MQRTTIMADDKLMADLRDLARREGVSLASVIRKGLEQHVRRERPQPSFIGIIPAGTFPPDFAERSIDADYQPRSVRS